MTYDVTVPANAQATVVLPVDDLAGVKLDGQSLADAGVALKRGGRFVLSAGCYTMTFSI